MQWSTVIMDSFVLHTVPQAAKVANWYHNISLFYHLLCTYLDYGEESHNMLGYITSRSSTCCMWVKEKVGDKLFPSRLN